jgi:uncharacterized membrane protein
VSSPTPRWVPISSLALCVAGLAGSAYLTYEHYSSSSTLACPDTGAINCLKVTTSSYASLLGVPVALLGLLFFIGITPLCLPAAWHSSQPWISRVRIAAVTAGVLFVLYLVWAELFPLDAICLWCTAVHAVTFALFVVVVMASALSPREPR